MQHIYHENILAAVNSAENLKTETCHKKNKFPIRTNAHISCEVAQVQHCLVSSVILVSMISVGHLTLADHAPAHVDVEADVDLNLVQE